MMLRCRSAFLAAQFEKSIQLKKVSEAQMIIRHMSSLPTGNNGADKTGSKKRGVYTALGTSALVGGLAYFYKVFSDDKYDPNDSLNWAKAQLGFSSTPLPTLSLPEIGGSLIGTDTQVSCAGKDECKEKEDKCADSTCLRKMDKEEQLIAKTNQDLEKALKEVKPKAMEATEKALKAYCEAVEAIKLFMDKAYCAIEEDNMESPRFEELWCEVYELALKRCEKVKDATQKGQCAWELLCKLREIIESGKNCKYTTCNPLLITAEETLSCAERELKNAKAKMDCVQSESCLVEQYKNLIEDFRRDVKAEMESLLTTSPDCRTNLTENECAMILTHAYKKVLRVQKELALVQASQGIESQEMMSSTLNNKLSELRDYYEGELIKALSRQSQAYQDTLDYTRELLKKEYERRSRQISDIQESEQLVELRNKYTQVSAALSAMRTALTEHKGEEQKQEELRRLWTLSSTLYKRINFSPPTQSDIDENITIDKSKLLSEFSMDTFAHSLISTMPEKVGSVESLRSRFFSKVDKTCRNVAVFREGENISLGKYLWGYFQASLITRCEGVKSEDSKNIYQVLDRTAYHLRRGELLEAVLTLNKTEGAARVVCESWLHDARGSLEASQTLSALMTYANAQNYVPL